jgi:hypothetical protein
MEIGLSDSPSIKTIYRNKDGHANRIIRVSIALLRHTSTSLPPEKHNDTIILPIKILHRIPGLKSLF